VLRVRVLRVRVRVLRLRVAEYLVVEVAEALVVKVAVRNGGGRPTRASETQGALARAIVGT
jgi:acyl-CoA hydrolase